jgi:hypothetical protein
VEGHSHKETKHIQIKDPKRTTIPIYSHYSLYLKSVTCIIYLSMNCSHCSTQLPKVQLFKSSLQNIYIHSPILSKHQHYIHTTEFNAFSRLACITAVPLLNERVRANESTCRLKRSQPRLRGSVVPWSFRVCIVLGSRACLVHHVSRLPVCFTLRSRIPQLCLFHELTRAIPSVTGLIHHLEY